MTIGLCREIWFLMDSDPFRSIPTFFYFEFLRIGSSVVIRIFGTFFLTSIEATCFRVAGAEAYGFRNPLS